MSIIEANQGLPTQNSDCVLFSASAATFQLTPLFKICAHFVGTAVTF
jgi:hypothetical protein